MNGWNVVAIFLASTLSSGAFAKKPCIQNGESKAAAQATLPANLTPPVENFSVVDLPANGDVRHGIYRFGRPSLQALNFMKDKLNLKFLINLEASPTENLKEMAWSSMRGVQYLEAYMFDKTWPLFPTVNAALGVMSAGGRDGSIGIHCRHGDDRTGVVVALYRILVQGSQVHDPREREEVIARAKQEMYQHGFSRNDEALYDYLNWKIAHPDMFEARIGE